MASASGNFAIQVLMLFQNRLDAAQQLLPLLEKFRGQDAVILAVPRGGVPIAAYLSQSLKLPLGILWVKKIGHPLNQEVAIGAVSLDGHTVDMNYSVDPKYINTEIARIHELLEERSKEFSGSAERQKITGRIVIIVDDGVATGKTLVAAIKMLKKQSPKKIVVAVPVSAPSGKSELSPMVNEFICVEAPADFMGVGMYYRDFAQVGDEEVKQLLKRTETS